MPNSENSELTELIDRIFTEEFGGRASAAEVFRSAATGIPEHLERHLIGAGLRAAIGKYFRTQRADGLPQAPEANDEGTHVQLEFLDVPEFQYVIVRQLKSSAASYSQAEKLAGLCKEIHGVVVSLDMLANELREAR